MEYNGIYRTITVVFLDDDTAGIKVTALPMSLAEVASSSTPSTGTFTVRLNSQPIAGSAVTVNVGGANSDISLSVSTLTFTTNSWMNTQTVTVSAIDDSDAEDRTETFAITLTSTSSDPKYANSKEVARVKTTAAANNLGGTFKLSFGGAVTSSIAHNATSTTMKTALELLGSMGDVTVSRRVSGNGLEWDITFDANGGDVEAIIISSSALTGTSASITASVVAEGSPSFIGKSHVVVQVLDDDSTVGISSVTAVDGAPLQEGLGTGDMISVVFAEDTNRPSLSSKTLVDVLFSFSATLGQEYSGSWKWVTLPGTISVSNGESALTTTYDLSSFFGFGDVIKFSGAQYDIDASILTSSSIGLKSPYIGSSISGISAEYQSRKELTLNISDATGTAPYADTKVGTLALTLRASGNLKDRAEASAASVATKVCLIYFTQMLLITAILTPSFI